MPTHLGSQTSGELEAHNVRDTKAGILIQPHLGSQTSGELEAIHGNVLHVGQPAGCGTRLPQQLAHILIRSSARAKSECLGLQL